MRILLMIVIILSPKYLYADIPKHNGKCGDVTSINMGDNLKICRVGDVIAVQQKIVPKYCDYRYAIIKLNGNGATAVYTCVMRVQKDN